MNREIKFRVWDAIGRFMTDEGKTPEGKGHMKYDVGVSVAVSQRTGKKQWHTGIDGLHVPDNDPELILMQYTGLKDKNGKEIYEGDWCRACFRDKQGFHFIQGQICMDDFMWCLDNSHYEPKDGIYSINRLHDWEVIGNIYENSELLTQKESL